MARASVNRSERHPGAKARLADSRNLRRLSDVHPELERLYGEAQNDDEFGDPDDGGHHALFIDAVVARRKKPINAIMITGAGGKIRVQEYFSAKLARSAFEEKRRVYRSMPGPRRNPPSVPPRRFVTRGGKKYLIVGGPYIAIDGRFIYQVKEWNGERTIGKTHSMIVAKPQRTP